MSLSLESIVHHQPQQKDKSWDADILAATKSAIKTYEQIVHTAPSKNHNGDPFLSRHVAVIAVLDRAIDAPWQKRVRGIAQLGSFEGVNSDESFVLFVAKALQRAVMAEQNPAAVPQDVIPAYLGLGRAHTDFSSGIAGPYPLHSRIVLDTFHSSLINVRHRGFTPPVYTLNLVDGLAVAARQLGGVNGDSGDNTEELEAARIPFTEFAESIAI